MNKLHQVSAEVHRLSAAEAELWVRIEAMTANSATEVRGRLTGPRCANVTTIEVAYPLQPFPRHPDGWPPLSRRVVIPDPSLWEQENPFTYHAILELWQDGQRCDLAEFDYGFRMAGERSGRIESRTKG